MAIYLEKENEELDKLIKKASSMSEISQLENRKQGFFTASEINISTIDVINSIDNNKRKLGANDAKYFAPTISFSENELSHIAFLATGKKEVTSILELNSSATDRTQAASAADQASKQAHHRLVTQNPSSRQQGSDQ